MISRCEQTDRWPIRWPRGRDRRPGPQNRRPRSARQPCPTSSSRPCSDGDAATAPAPQSPPLPSPSPRVRMRGRRLKTHRDATPSAAPIAGWAIEFKSSGLTAEQMRNAVWKRSYKTARSKERKKQKAEGAEMWAEHWKQKVRTARRSCAALLQRLSGPPRSAGSRGRLGAEGRRVLQRGRVLEAEGAHTPTLVCCFVAASERSAAVCRQQRPS
jgi:hypothetical protein